MKKIEQHALPSFATFRGEVASAHPDVAFTQHFLRSIYKLALQRVEYDREATLELERSAEMRRWASKFTRAIKRARKLERHIAALRANLKAAGFHPQAFELLEKGVESVIDSLNAGRQNAIDQIFPTRAHGFTQKWEPPLRLYDLPRLGFTAAYSWFIMAADDLLVRSYKRKNGSRKMLSPKQEWAILHTFVWKLFREKGSSVESIERLVRAARLKRSESAKKEQADNEMRRQTLISEEF